MPRFGPLLFVFALVLRVAAVAVVGDLPSIRGYECEAISHSLLEGDGYAMPYFGPRQATAHQYPLYCFLMAGHFALFGFHYLPLQLFQAVVGAFSCVLLWRLGARVSTERIGRIAGLLAAVYPVYVYWTARLQALTIEVALLIALLLLIDRAFERPTLSRFIGAGVLFGAACLSKSLYLVFLPVIFAWAAWRWGTKGLSKPLGAFAVAAALVILPWTARNWIVLGEPVLISSNGGWNLYVGANPHASGSTHALGGVPMPETVPESLRARLLTLDDLGKDRLFREQAIAWIQENPGEYLSLVPAKLRALWWFDPHTPTSFETVRVIVYLTLLAAAAAGAYRARPYLRGLSVFAGLALVSTGVYATFYGSPRFRYAIEFGFLILAAIAVDRVRAAMRGERPSTPIPE